MTDELADLLQAFPFKPNKKGKMIHLLKSSSKKISTGRERKKYTKFDLNKLVRPRDDS